MLGRRSEPKYRSAARSNSSPKGSWPWQHETSAWVWKSMAISASAFMSCFPVGGSAGGIDDEAILAGVHRVDQFGPPRQDGPLVDRTLVGDFAVVDRRRCFEQAQPGDAVGRAGGGPVDRGEKAAEMLAHRRVGHHLELI